MNTPTQSQQLAMFYAISNLARQAGIQIRSARALPVTDRKPYYNMARRLLWACRELDPNNNFRDDAVFYYNLGYKYWWRV